MIMSDHLRDSYLRQLSEAELDEPVQREREEVLELSDEETNLKFMVTYLCGICRRMRGSRAGLLYLPVLEDGVEVALADASALLKVLEHWENVSPVKLVALRRAFTGQWLRRDKEEVERESRDLSICLLQVEVERGLTMAVAAAAETRYEDGEELWGTPEEEDQRRMAVAARALRLKEASARAVEEVAQRAFCFYG